MKHSLLRLSILALVLTINTVVFASTFVVNGIKYSTTSSSTVEVSAKYPKYEGNVVIPESVNYNEITYSVTSIGNYAFYNCNSLASVTIPNSVKSIGNNAFQGCVELSSVVIPNGVITIGDSSFEGCSNLTSVTIGNNVSTIGKYAFWHCSKLNDVTFGEKLSSIGTGAFQYCNSLTTLSFSNIKEIGQSAFERCEELLTVSFGDSISVIDIFSFKDCKKLREISIPNSVTNLGSGVFSGCQELRVASIGYGVTSLGLGIFNGCANLEKISLNCTKINKCISGNTAIKELLLGDSVRTIEKNAFEGLSNLSLVSFGKSIESIGKDAFKGCKIDTVYYSCKIIDASFPKGKNVFIEEGVESIGNETFQNSSITTINIPNTVKTIGDNAFRASSLTHLSLGEGTTTIGKRAFAYCKGLTEIIIPKSINNIDYEAFAYCENLTKATFHCDSIGMWFGHGFWDSSLNQIVLGNEVRVVGNSAFEYSEISEITIPNSVVSIGDDAFYDCKRLNSVTIPGSVRTIGKQAFYCCYGLKSVTIEEGVTHIGERAFHVYGLDSLIIPNSVKEIGDEAFRGIHYIEIGDGVEKMGSNIVDKCDTLKFHCPIISGFGEKLKLKKLILGDGVKTVFRNSFYYSHIDTLLLGNTIEEIGNEAFWGCGIKECVFPNSLKRIGYWAFTKNRFQNLIIPPNIEEIEDGAFSENMELYKLTIEDSDNSLNLGRLFIHNLHPDRYVIYIGRNLSCDIKSIFNFNEIEYVTIDTLIFGDKLSKAWGCSELRINNLQLSKNTMTIEHSAFANATIPYIEIPNSVVEIKTSAFDRCKCDSFTLGNSIEKIGDYSFRGTGILRKPLLFPETLNELGIGAFQTSYSGQSIVFTSLEPPLIKNDNIFSNPYGGGASNTVYVPNVSFEKYMSKWNLHPYNTGIGPMNILVSVDVVGYDDINEIFGFNGETRITVPVKGKCKLFSIYDIKGNLVRRTPLNINGLPSGIYIMNGRKVVVKN